MTMAMSRTNISENIPGAKGAFMILIGTREKHRPALFGESRRIGKAQKPRFPFAGTSP